MPAAAASPGKTEALAALATAPLASPLYRRALTLALCLCAFTAPLSIAAAEGALALAAIAWLALGRPGPRPAFLGPLLLFALLTLASAISSIDPVLSLLDARQLLLLGIVLLVPALSSPRRLLVPFWSGSAAAAAWAIYAYVASDGGLAHRARGPLGHYMTLSGVLMIAVVSLGAVWLGPTLTPSRWRRLLPAGFVLTLCALVFTYARNAWLGCLAGLCASLLLVRPKAAPLILAAAALLFLLAPAELRARARSIADPGANQDRIEMARVGLELVFRSPLLGVGPGHLPRAYADLEPERPQPHLHNNLLQVAAERGLPAAAAWVWLMLSLLASLFQRTRGGPGRAGAAAGFGAVAALLVAGTFEYNFGDSEVLMALLLVAAAGLGGQPNEPCPS